MKLEIILNSKNASDEIHELNDFIQEQNSKGLITKVVQRISQPSEMSIGDYLPIIQIILTHTIAVAGIKGLFDVIKKYIDLKIVKTKANSERDKATIEKYKITFTFETNNKEKISLHFSSFNETERKIFFETVDKGLNE